MKIIVRLCFSLLMVLSFSFVYGQAQNSGDAKTDNQGDSFIGEWHALNGAGTITIQKEQDHFTLDDNGKKSILKYKNNELQGDNPSVHVIYNSFNAHIFWQKKEFEYANNTTADAPPEVTSSQPINNNTGNSYDIVLGANYPVGLIRDNLNASLSTAESILFRFIADETHPRKMLFLDFDFHMADPNAQFVANSVYSAMVNTHRFKRVFFDKYQQDANDTIFYIVNYSDIEASAFYVGRVDMYGNQLPDYTAKISCKVSITDYNGKVIYSNIFKRGDKVGERIHLLRYATEEEAIKQSAGKLSDEISDFFSEKFPVVSSVISVDDAGRDGNAKTIILKGGENMGISEQTGFKIIYKDKQIGTVKVKSVDEKTSVCKVLDGGDAITAKLAAGKILKAVSE